MEDTEYPVYTDPEEPVDWSDMVDYKKWERKFDGRDQS